MENISQIVINKVDNFLTSFVMSTNKTIELKGEKLSLFGANSPYTSHKSISIDDGHNIAETIILKVKDYSMIVMRVGIEFETVGDSKIHSCILPSYLIKNAIRRSGLPSLFEQPRWITDYPEIRVIMNDNFIQYDDDGKPMFTETKSKVSIKGTLCFI